MGGPDVARSVALALWELPQNVLGAAVLAVAGAIGEVEHITPERGRLFVESRHLAVSLGWFVFWTRRDVAGFEHDVTTREHEWGHTFQSRAFGPLYLPLVGAPSVARVLYSLAHHRLTGRRWGGYFDGWPEKQADRLGGITRRRP